MTTNRRPLVRTSRKGTISREAVEAYRRARELYNKPMPLDPVKAEAHSRAYYEVTDQLRVALHQEIWELEVLDAGPEPPKRASEERLAEWARVRELRRELERLADAVPS